MGLGGSYPVRTRSWFEFWLWRAADGDTVVGSDCGSISGTKAGVGSRGYEIYQQIGRQHSSLKNVSWRLDGLGGLKQKRHQDRLGNSRTKAPASVLLFE